MGTTYQLANRTKGELVSFFHIPASKARELAGNSVAAAITTWYLLQNRGDEIAFISDEDRVWPVAGGAIDECWAYHDVTDAVVQQLIEANILKDEGVVHYFEDEPEVYDRLLRNVWMDDDSQA